MTNWGASLKTSLPPTKIWCTGLPRTQPRAISTALLPTCTDFLKAETDGRRDQGRDGQEGNDRAQET